VVIDLSTCDVHSVCEKEEELIGAASEATGPNEDLSIPGILFGGRMRDICSYLSQFYTKHNSDNKQW
jgi:hypothetical protein